MALAANVQDQTTMSVDGSFNGAKVDSLVAPFTTTWSFDATTLTLSLDSEHAAFHSTEQPTADAKVASGCTHLTGSHMETTAHLQILTAVQIIPA